MTSDQVERCSKKFSMSVYRDWKPNYSVKQLRRSMLKFRILIVQNRSKKIYWFHNAVSHQQKMRTNFSMKFRANFSATVLRLNRVVDSATQIHDPNCVGISNLLERELHRTTTYTSFVSFASDYIIVFFEEFFIRFIKLNSVRWLVILP